MKKLIALLFVVAMLCAAMVMPAMAANEAPAITVSSAAAGEGQTATLNILHHSADIDLYVSH